MVGQVLALLMLATVRETVDGGWDPHDLAELVRRRDPSWLPMLAAALHDHSLADGPADPHWRAAVEAIAAPTPLLLRDRRDFAHGLGLTALLAIVPKVRAEAGAPRSAAHPESKHPKWHQVRSLLAKAESTEFGPEAEALVAKAQELISRYSLERLLESEEPTSDQQHGVPVQRRLWLERPYVVAKASLVNRVARANHCHAATAEKYGFVILVGDQADLDAVELLVTSLLLQADVAMLRCGRGEGHAGRHGRTKAFRQSFLVAYAYRIGERLDAAREAAASSHANALPVLRDHDARVAEAFAAMVPTSPGRSVSATDNAGWYAGTTAADLALIDASPKLTG